MTAAGPRALAHGTRVVWSSAATVRKVESRTGSPGAPVQTATAQSCTTWATWCAKGSALRATPAAGIGANVITTYKWNWDVEFAPAGYQYLSLLTAAAGVQNPQNDGYMMFRTFADLDFTDDIQLLLEWRTNLVYTTIGNTNHVGSLDFTSRLTTIIYFNTAFLYLRTEDPWPRADGTVPKKNDYQVVVAISLRLG